MRYSCTTCDATLQTAAGSPPRERMACPSCGSELAAEAKVFHLPTDRDPTRRYDLDELKARLQAEKEAVAALTNAPAARTPDQVWFVGVQGRQVGPLTAVGLSGLRTRGHLGAGTLVWREGFPSWIAAEIVPELRPLLGLPESLPSLPFPDEPTAPGAHGPSLVTPAETSVVTPSAGNAQVAPPPPPPTSAEDAPTETGLSLGADLPAAPATLSLVPEPEHQVTPAPHAPPALPDPAAADGRVIELAIADGSPPRSADEATASGPSLSLVRRAAEPAYADPADSDRDEEGDEPVRPSRGDRTAPDAKLPSAVASAEAARPRRGYRPKAEPAGRRGRRSGASSSAPPPASGTQAAAAAVPSSTSWVASLADPVRPGPERAQSPAARSETLPAPAAAAPFVDDRPSFTRPLPSPSLARKIAAGLAIAFALAAAALLWHARETSDGAGSAATSAPSGTAAQPAPAAPEGPR